MRTERVKRARATAAELGHRLAQVRELRGLTMAQVEKVTAKGIERSALSRIENGSRPNPSLATLLMLAVAYDIDIKIRRDGTINMNGTKLTELANKRLRDQLPKEGTK